MADPKDKPTTAIAKVQDAAESKELTVAQRKAFLEVASRTDLDKLNDQQKVSLLVAFGQHTGLRPELGEVMIYQGRFYITMAGRVRNAHANGIFDGMKARPASMIEKKNGGYEQADIVWVTDVFRRGAAGPFRGWGKVTRAEMDTARAGDRTKYTPVAKHPVEMARKRSEYDALRLAFPLQEHLTGAALKLIEEAEEQAAARLKSIIHTQDDRAAEVEMAAEAGEELGATEGPDADLELDKEIADQ